jgi:hypothetical protein
MKKTLFVTFLIVLLGMYGLWANTLQVPGNYPSIQAAIDAANSGDVIEISVLGSPYNETLNIYGKNNLTIRGINNGGYPIIKPSTVTDWNYYSYSDGKKTAIRIVESNNITIENIVLDCDLVKDNGYSGILYANSTGGVFSHNVFRNMSTSQSPNEDVMIYARADSPYTAVDRATLTLNYCDLYDTGKVALSTNNYIDTSVDHCNFYKTTEAYGLGMGICSSSSASITNSEFHGFNLNENDNLPTAIYIDNLGTQNENGVDKTVTIQNCEIYNCQAGIIAGNLIYFDNSNNNVGDVDIILNIIENNIHDNNLSGIFMTEGYKSNGSSLSSIITGNSITVPVKNPDTIGVLAATNKNGDLSIYLEGNTISGYDIGLACMNTVDNEDPDYSSFNISITNGNTFSNHSYGVGIVNINCPTPPIISGNYFNHNKPVHFLKDDSITLDLSDILANNTFDHAKLAKNVIYGDGTVIYADAPKSLIKGNETQIYTVKASYIEHLRSFTVRVQIPKADFATEPTNFTLGSSFNSPVMITRGHTSDYWIFNVSGAIMGPVSGVTGTDIVLFTFQATSSGNQYANVPDGCMIEIPLDFVTLYDDQNPYQSIQCDATLGFNVLIDGIIPNVSITNLSQYPDGMTLSVNAEGIICPALNFSYTDNYNLSSAMYLIQLASVQEPTEPSHFTETVGTISGTSATISDWELPASSLTDGTYVLYLLVTDEAGNYNIIGWTFIVDITPPSAITWVKCLTTPNGNVSIDLQWSYDLDNPPAYVNIWALNYAEISGINANGYPYYNATNLIGPNTIINDIDPYSNEPSALGWKKVAKIPLVNGIEYGISLNNYYWSGMTRGYYYITLYGEDNNGQMSAAPAEPFYRESISYWPGDVVSDYGSIDATDINTLSFAWGATSANYTQNWNPLCEVGPTVDRARRSRPMPDGKIDIEDLMIFAMNYNNTNYNYYPRNIPETQPITITMNSQYNGEQLTVSLVLDGNTGFVKGLDIPLAYGNGLQLLSVESGEIWSENGMMLYINENGVVTISGASLGADELIEGNGTVATLVFSVVGNDTSLGLGHMTARSCENEDIEIVNNPTGDTNNEDSVNIIPVDSYLGKVYPNPFNPSTTLQYGLKEAGQVKISVFNARGQLIRTLVNESKAAGTYQIVWDGKDNNGHIASSGIYFFRMETKEGIKATKGLMIK